MKNFIKNILSLIALITILPAVATEYHVDMLTWGKSGSMVFKPAVLQIQSGDTVTFIPKQAGHQVQSQVIPIGAKSFKSELDEKFSVVLEKPGIYIYTCPPHSMMNMSGIIQVGNSIVNMDAANAGIDKIEQRTMQNKGRLKQYMVELTSRNGT